MNPRDVPMRHLHALTRQLAEYARQEHERARANPAPELRVGAYEAALAYGNAATAAREAGIGMVSDLDRMAENEQQEPHPWPIAGLDNHAGVFDPPPIPDQSKRFPAWGIELGEATNRSTYLTVQKSAHDGEVFLRAVSGVTGGEDRAPDNYISGGITIEQWRALNALVERIAAGQPIPYDAEGNVHNRVPTGSVENED